MARYGASICFVSYFAPLNRWTHIHNGTEAVIEPAPEWWCYDEDVSDEMETPSQDQLELDL